jgi:hypothetical protein
MQVRMTATVRDGGLQLDEPIGFPDHYRVQVSVEPLPAAEQDWQVAFHAFQALCDERPIDSGGIRFSREELHERR